MIFLTTIIFIKVLGKKLSDNIYMVGNRVLENVITNSVNANIKGEVLKKYNINDLIEINQTNNNIDSVSYNLEKAYELLIEIKTSLINDIKKINKINDYDAYFKDNKLFLKIPFYNYTNNLLLANIGPKIETHIDLLQTISGNVYTNIEDYGINSLKLELYISFNSVSNIVVPFREEEIMNDYELLIATKVIQGNIPSIYNGILESNSGLINLN